MWQALDNRRVNYKICMTKSTLLLYTTVCFNFISFWWIRRLHKMEFKQIETHFCTHFTLRRTFMYHLEVLLAMSPFLPIFTKCCSLLRSSSSQLRSSSGAAPPILPSDLVTLGVLLWSSSTLAPLSINFTRRKWAAPEQMEEYPP